MATKKNSSKSGKFKKKVAAQGAAYVKGYKLESLSENEILESAGITKNKNGKYVNPETNRPYKSKDTALDSVAKQSGFRSFDNYKETRKTRAYKQFEKRARLQGKQVKLGSRFSKLFGAWKKGGYTKRSEEMRELLVETKWIDLHNYTRYSKTKPVENPQAYTVTGYTKAGKPKIKKGNLKGVI